MSFATLGEMASRRKQPYVESTPMGPPPSYSVDRDDTLNPGAWNMRYWSWKKWAALVAGVIIVVVIIVIVVVEVEKKNKYPDYSALTYTLADTCKCSPSLTFQVPGRMSGENKDFADNQL
jgi:hypothetical protein